MPELVPVNMSVDAAVAVAQAALPAGADDLTVPAAPGVDELCNWTQENRSMSVHAAATLGFPVGDVDAGGDRQILLFGTSRWADVDTAAHTFRFGVSLRVVLQISDLKFKGALTLPLVAAHVDTTDATAAAEMIIRGYRGPLGDALPTWQSFGVEQYAQYMQAISTLQKTVMGAGADALTPQLLATSAVAAAMPTAEDTGAFVHAVGAIAHGEPLRQALTGQSQTSTEQIRQVYDSAGITDVDADPSPEQRSAARSQIVSWGLAHGVHHRLHLPWQHT